MKAIAGSKIFSSVEGRNQVEGWRTFCILNQNWFSYFEFPIACLKIISWIGARRSYFCDYFNNNSLLDTKIKNHKWIVCPFFIFFHMVKKNFEIRQMNVTKFRYLASEISEIGESRKSFQQEAKSLVFDIPNI